MKTISRYIMTLALLLTAVGGAWAQTQWESGDCTVTLNNGTLTVSGNGGMADYLNGSDRPWDGNSGDITSVVVESGVTSVGFNAFYFFSNLTSVTLPEGLTAIGPNAFMSCFSLTSVTIPSTVTSISESAFSSCSAMTSVTLPEGLTAIGANAFSDCSSLTSITVPSTVTSIGQAAFMGCSAITSVTLPEGLTAIGTGAFGRCSSLTSITIPSTVTSIGGYAFTLSSAISDVNLYANPDNLTWGNTSSDFKSGKATQCHVLAEHLSTYQNNFSSVNVTFVGDLEPLPTPIKVTTNAASAQDLFTEASFTMPPFDATVNYMLVRDMQDETNPVIFSGLPSSGNIVVKKGSDGKYQPAEALTIQLIDPLAAAEAQNIIAADGITIKVLVGDDSSLPIEYDQDNPITLEAFLADMKPGYYWIKAEQTDENSPYDGTVYSSEFTVVEKYDLAVKPANDFSKGKVESVTVGSGSVTIDANGKASKTGIDPETEVKIKAKHGYVIDKVEVKKTMKLLTLTVNGVTIYYAEGDSWANAISRDENKDSGLFIREGNRVHHTNYGQLVDSNTEAVLPEAIINANESYRFIK
ncbi:leucine-rich repeat domain-containing protein [Prevotella communis]|uniref:leucine-rich repeat domain-containing protein n=1 Tax=Prevotella communis TaxID=2913614 RepID=UPI001EDA859D|nr:leucine-rich repeat domain-containing protein [Prevotella communis]UKK62230.1 leucine-rich repeat domain-containing protein [Prevotella communis]UKK65057.1 leucine-rich repeat domain-containing protein [Prevotella communis]UKK67442.1 leucine-rich repeat domain-containing protein [Prevotella communis]UKK70411.1 leucine-rich repeat domain-containing protein [Prevotella communis]